jgi:hypothetical protein
MSVKLLLADKKKDCIILISVCFVILPILILTKICKSYCVVHGNRDQITIWNSHILNLSTVTFSLNDVIFTWCSIPKK